ncbi:MAG: AAA family ATPase [Gammaproteobacteria bacterium]|nr:AAA family ATPase [Gammaproteobacteria bacterium]MBU1654584.1 AAA family ATPase [Gammaproteobacteria bacterium]MBU1961976.1 AAA family ATPase [Gammaproteobacteria bacterium]
MSTVTEIQQKTQSAPDFVVWDWQEFKTQPPPQPWLVEGLIPAEGACDVYGPPGAGKSTLLYNLGAVVAAGGGDWFGHRAVGGRVVILGGESSNKRAHWRTANRAMRMAGVEERDLDLFTLPQGPILRWSRGAYHDRDHKPEGWYLTEVGDRTMDWLDALSPNLVLVDTILGCAAGCNLLDQPQQYALGAMLGQIATRLDTTVITISHTNQASMGSRTPLSERLCYTARAGGNGAPAAWRWMGGVSALRQADKKLLGRVADGWRLDAPGFFAFGASKYNEVGPGGWIDLHPAIFQIQRGDLRLVATGEQVSQSMREAEVSAAEKRAAAKKEQGREGHTTISTSGSRSGRRTEDMGLKAKETKAAAAMSSSSQAALAAQMGVGVIND